MVATRSKITLTAAGQYAVPTADIYYTLEGDQEHEVEDEAAPGSQDMFQAPREHTHDSREDSRTSATSANAAKTMMRATRDSERHQF